jgi:hypothetical protein
VEREGNHVGIAPTDDATGWIRREGGSRTAPTKITETEYIESIVEKEGKQMEKAPTFGTIG